jgi:hypothetical protein
VYAGREREREREREKIRQKIVLGKGRGDNIGKMDGKCGIGNVRCVIKE